LTLKEIGRRKLTGDVHAEVDWDETRGMKHGKARRNIAGGGDLVWLGLYSAGGARTAGRRPALVLSRGYNAKTSWRLFVRYLPGEDVSVLKWRCTRPGKLGVVLSDHVKNLVLAAAARDKGGKSAGSCVGAVKERLQRCWKLLS